MRRTAFAVMLAGACALAAPLHAQTWTSPRSRPPLWQIISVDRSGEKGWLWGAEDIAKDGAAKYEMDEAATDLRTVYADSDRDRLWIRAYVGTTQPPPANLLFFAFLDTDARSDTGGGADATALRSEFSADPSRGGYERAFGVQADGSILGAWRWDTAQRKWVSLAPRGDEDAGAEALADSIAVEARRDRDPVRVAGLEHGYLQFSAAHTLTGLNANCAANIFVRSWLDAAAPRSFGDEVQSEARCRPALDAFGDPNVLRVASCDADADCPAAGRCREQVCLLEYECDADADCRSEERCDASVCTKVVSGACDVSADCEGLVCDDGSCVACAERGARACATGRVCAPNGECLDPKAVGPGPTGGSGAAAGSGAGPSDLPPGKVRGGAFHCALAPEHGRAVPAWLLGLVALALAARGRRRVR